MDTGEKLLEDIAESLSNSARVLNEYSDRVERSLERVDQAIEVFDQIGRPKERILKVVRSSNQ